MLIQFTVGNCLSFNGEKTLEMFASRQTNLQEQLYIPESRYIPKILKAAIVFGPNASGKSNLIKVIDYAVSVVLNKPSTLKGRYLFFKLSPECYEKPSTFQFEILIEKTIYRLGFAIKNDIIEEEWLYKAISTGEQLIYCRNYDENGKNKNKIEFGEKYSHYIADEQLNLILSITPPNNLFLYESVKRNRDDFKEVYEWFKKVVIIYPKTSFKLSEQNVDDEELLDLYRLMLKKSDTGIEDIEIKQSDSYNFAPKLSSKNNKSENESPGLTLTQKDKTINYNLIIKRKSLDKNKEIEFNLNEESDGTNRLFHLIPILKLIKKDSIILVDELDRSLHPLLSRFLLHEFFKLGIKHKSQLIATSHDVTLLNVKLLRRDSIWFIKKNYKMASTLYSLVEYESVRNDKVLSKAYLSGLYGAIPMLDKEE